MVLSEIINSILRIEYRKARKRDEQLKYFKAYRNSLDGQAVLDDIHTILREYVLSRFHIAQSIFHKADIENMMTVDDLDFNDKGIRHICQENSFVLLTNDGDSRIQDWILYQLILKSCSKVIKK